ncbi:hypothetical protein GCM10010387_04010 [Streptomyces inusitatus]|uniref:YcaO domain-containing protein n=1 Tax=Streptomyces inusitatus TaxID=68221 RepID=A0A918UJK7_9ACTN|nr:YcaO-like family protein [Streptomyces inusitatus]GGZ14944.1 hypothetical protein GCM10010387_04010 [Streptomyces inusitatus]
MSERIVLDGTVRTRSPETTWKALEPELPTLGITRVARLTDLDYLRIPVWTAIRPQSHSLVTTQGKGADDTLAKISAVLEGAELWLIEQPPTYVEHGTHHALGVPYPMSALPVKRDHPELAHVPLDWTAGTGLVSGRSLLVPADLVHRRRDRADSQPEPFDITSNGLAAGNSYHEAALHGLFEVVERDALQRDDARGGSNRALLDLATVKDRYCRDLINRFLNVGMFLEIALVDSPCGLPVCAAYIWSEDYPILFGGSGCHRDPHIALSRALTEAAQSRLTCIAGTRDDLDSHEAVFTADPPRPAPAGPYTGDWATLISRYDTSADDLAAETVAVARSITAVTGHEPVAVTLYESPAFAGVKIISPGMAMRTTRSIPRPGGHPRG